MSPGKLLRASAFAAIVLAGLQLDAAADPITYEGELLNGVTAAGALPVGDYYDARDADFWMFWATAGDSVEVAVRRVDSELDPAQWIYRGVYYDTADPDLSAGTHYFQSWLPAFVAFADDVVPNPGPYGDPYSAFVAPATGWYTVGVTEYLSGPLPNDGDYDYDVTVRGITGTPPGRQAPVPEPTMLALLTCGAFGVFLARRRKAA
ncbi:MAG: PEP-CTERM sorting domain-containing protein [Planctomycetes bacterium]|nr:PEP-CTERM sorting domain-containing protein [Planctomycetota bacterium]